ncbi:NAD-dependent epimerase/dehydratase family protein [Campylobacter hyointestinalis]|uniref:NAD-dependent epimerase/dehydratase family protein n=1 Tax=Campylobacter hyointestinalis TaxID=198 RepID=UPI000DCD3637|nr:NAD(P)-dependent oxidoreductase [Campylobacter hyointestinalis]RAZ49863.1 NAD(P)-dependent oxidoreductase [Campylobacter hyointestinalis subsp. lawsonii]
MNIFITGGSGFIGSHLKEYLKMDQGIVCFVPTSKELDLSKEFDVERYVIDNRIDTIVHLANKGGSRDTVNVKNVTEYNLRIFFNIVKCQKYVKKIISFGSGAEYGKHKPIVNIREYEYNKSLPLDEYGFYKALTSRYIELSNNIIQLRLFGVYGEYEDYRYKFITNAIVKNLLHLPIKINQNVYFDYMYVDDLLKMVKHFIMNDAKYKIYNASSGIKVDLLTLAGYINEISDYTSEIIVLNGGLNNEYTSDNSLIKTEMGDKFFITPHQNAIEKIYKYYKKNLDGLDTETVKADPYITKVNKIWIDKK